MNETQWQSPETAPELIKILMTIQPSKDGDYTEKPFVAIGWLDNQTIFGTGTRREKSTLTAWMPLPEPYHEIDKLEAE